MTGEWLERPATKWAVLFLIVGFFAITNLPWTLDDYDQAKQAYTSFEMVGQGHWLYQHTPNESVATKPPLVGWVSAALFEVTRWWEGAWRIPSFARRARSVVAVEQEATAAYGAVGGLIALSAFGLNLLSPRLATLVRTDMPLALVTFLIGAQIWRKIRRAEAWTTRDRVIAFLLLSCAMMIKGPIIYAFILPGLIVYQILRRKSGPQRHGAGSGRGSCRSPFSSSGQSAESSTRTASTRAWSCENLPAGLPRRSTSRSRSTFIFPHLLHKFAPWSVLLIGLGDLFLAPSGTLALRCDRKRSGWSAGAIGGLLLMSVIPSKRVDRIFPIVPPLCLLLGAQVARVVEIERWRNEDPPWLAGALHFRRAVHRGLCRLEDRLSPARAERCARAIFRASARPKPPNIIGVTKSWADSEEGMLLYLRRSLSHARRRRARWQANQLDALVVRNQPLRPGAIFSRAPSCAVSEKAHGVPRYSLFVR